MIPILYAPTEQLFDSNGLGMLADAIDVDVLWQVNGQYELEMRYPVEGLRFGSLVCRGIILAQPDPETVAQPFRIYRITKPHRGEVTVYARHLAYDCQGIPVAPFRAYSAMDATQKMQNNAAVACPFTFSTDVALSKDYSLTVPKSAWNAMSGSPGGILRAYGGEWDFDRWNITLRQRLGRDRGVTIRYGKNLTTLEQDENVANCYTALYPYWTDSDGNLYQLPERLIQCDGEYDHVRVKVVRLDFETAPTEEQLREAGLKYIEDNNIGVPEVSWKIQFVHLEQSPEYADRADLYRVGRGDTVSVYFPKLLVEATARVNATRYKPMLDRYSSVTLGAVKATVADTIVEQGRQIGEQEEKLSGGWAAATEWLTNGRGYMVVRKDAEGNAMDLLFMDTPDIDTAQNVLRVGQSGLGFSRTGVEGPYTSAWTLDGNFYADNVHLTGKFQCYPAADGESGGWLGYLEGSDGTNVTTGIGMADATGRIYVIATGKGIRLQCGERFFYMPIDGDYIATNVRIIGHEGKPLELGDVNITGRLLVNGVEQ